MSCPHLQSDFTAQLFGCCLPEVIKNQEHKAWKKDGLSLQRKTDAELGIEIDEEIEKVLEGEE